jgi:hypothetical protein
VTGPNHDDCPHSGTWAETVENLGCGLLTLLFVLGVIAVCTWGVTR